MMRRDCPSPHEQRPVGKQASDHGETDHENTPGALALLVALMAPAAVLFWVAVAWFCWKRLP